MTADELEKIAQEAMRKLRGVVKRQAEQDAARGAALRYCVECGWTIADLARELGVTRGTVYRWMTVGADRADV